MNSYRSTTVFVTAAQIAAHLYFATKVAQDLSLTAKNARAITTRAGQLAMGFNAITTFIQELASETINLASDINKKAIQISMQATQLERTQQAKVRFKRAVDLGADANFISTINPYIAINQQELDTLAKKFNLLQKELSNLIEQTEKQVRSATVISSMSKIEASKSGDFQTQLEVIASNIFSSADAIKKELTSAKSLLRHMRELNESH